ncbi:MAG: aldo/keto reductase [bacterium]
MKTKTIPNTDISVSELCLGTMNFGQMCDEAEAHAQLDYATSHGINFIDTAEMYPVPPDKTKQGTTERFVGNWLAKTGKRKEIVLASKISSAHQIGSMGTRAASGLTRENVRAAIDGSLSRLQTDYLDLYQLHSPDRKANFWGPRGVATIDPSTDGASIEETLSALTELVKEGKVRAIGLSNETPWGVSEYVRLSREKGLTRISTIQNQYSLINRTFEVGLSEMCLRENVGLLAYSPLSKGVLSGKYLDGALPPDSRFAYSLRDFDRYNPKHAQVAIQKYKEIAEKHNLSLSVLSLAFALERSFMTSVILGARTGAQLIEDMSASEHPLSPEILAEIESLYQEYPDPTA